ncbi:MAG: hypothetical protein ACRDQZ_00445, partial [Mycobacteriales bacterium]
GAPGSLVGIRTPREVCEVVSLDATCCLARALARRQVIVRQCGALGVVLAGCAVWWLSPLGEPEPYVGLVLVFGGAALVVDIAVGWDSRVRATVYADELILAGFTCALMRTPIERAVLRRLCWVEKPRSRHRLASDLRWRLELAQGFLRPSPGYLRISVLPPLVAYERQALCAESSLVWKMADRIDRAPADPRALVLLWSVISTPPSLDRDDWEAGEELRRRLRAAQAIIASTDQTDPPAAAMRLVPPTTAWPS